MINEKDIVELIKKYNDAEIEYCKLKNKENNKYNNTYTTWNISTTFYNYNTSGPNEMDILKSYIKALKHNIIKLIEIG